MIRRAHDADLLLCGRRQRSRLAAGAAASGAQQPHLAGRERSSRSVLSIKLLDKPIRPVSRADGDVHVQGNPHYWLDPENGLVIATAIAARLPSNWTPRMPRIMTNNSRRFRRVARAPARLARAPGLAQGPAGDQLPQIVVYLAAAFGFRVVAEIEPKPGIPPSPAHLGQLVERIQTEKIGLLIMEPFYERRSAAYLSEHAGIKTALVPQSVSTEAGIKNYFDLFDAIVTALNKTRGS